MLPRNTEGVMIYETKEFIFLGPGDLALINTFSAFQ